MANVSLYSNPICVNLRTRLENLREPQNAQVPDHRRFYPASRIQQLFSLENVSQLLNCGCQRCTDTRTKAGFKVTSRCASHICGKSQHDRSEGHTALLILAILLYIDASALIFGFLGTKCYDCDLEKELEKFTSNDLAQKFWPKLIKSDASLAQSIADRFHWRKYQFIIPVIRDDSFSTYSKEVILPFVNEQSIDSEGAHSNVYSFEILDEYRGFEAEPELRSFARKELKHNGNPRMFNIERDNLMHVKKLRDPHLVHIVKAYMHGITGNIIFPLAKANLGNYLRHPSIGAPLLGLEGIESHPFWEQMLGLARALHKVLNYEAKDLSRNDILYGFHFDLKPANILVEESGRFVITDFGFAHFKKTTENPSSQVRGMGGTEAYAPPEIYDRASVQNRKYDIWSLGCILIEICAFVIKGHHGVDELDKVRETAREALRQEGDAMDDRFFVQRSQIYMLKPEILAWIQHLPKTIHEQSTKKFVSDILALALGMLEPKVDLRVSSKKVCEELADILGRRQPRRSVVQSSTNPFDNLSTGELEPGKLATPGIKSLSASMEGFWRPGPFRFLESDHILTLMRWENPNWVPSDIGQRSHLILVPRYALGGNTNPRFVDASLYILPISDASALNSHGKMFSSNELHDNLLLQEALLGQKVVENFGIEEIQNVSLNNYEDTVRKIARYLKKPNMEYMHTEAAKTIQLWEASPEEHAAGDNKAKRKSSLPRFSRHGPHPRRIVIFYSSWILIIRLAKNFRIISSSRDPKISPSVHFGPTDASADPRFAGLVLKCRRKGPPGVPLNPTDLTWEEDNNFMDFQSLKLDFSSTSAANKFTEAYRRLKREWMKEQDQYENLKPEIGPTIGYAEHDY